MAKIVHNNEKSNTTALYLTDSLFSSLFKQYTPYEVYSHVDGVFSILNFEKEILEASSSGRPAMIRLANMLMTCTVLSQLLNRINMAASEQYKSSLIKELEENYDPGLIAIGLDDLIERAATCDGGSWHSEKTFHCLNALKRVYWLLSAKNKDNSGIQALLLSDGQLLAEENK